MQNYIDNQRLGELVEEHSSRDKSLNFTAFSYSSCDLSVLYNKYFSIVLKLQFTIHGVISIALMKATKV